MGLGLAGRNDSKGGMGRENGPLWSTNSANKAGGGRTKISRVHTQARSISVPVVGKNLACFLILL